MTIRSSHSVQAARLVRQVARLAAETPAAPSPLRDASASPDVQHTADDIAARILEDAGSSFSTKA